MRKTAVKTELVAFKITKKQMLLLRRIAKTTDTTVSGLVRTSVLKTLGVTK